MQAGLVAELADVDLHDVDPGRVKRVQPVGIERVGELARERQAAQCRELRGGRRERHMT